MTGWVFIVFGVFTIVPAALNWEWFMTHRKAHFFVNLIGRTGTRIFYIFLGVALLTLGVLDLKGIF